ncbi:hypothetical protein E2562_028170 [Oryza meyeriana var. granulata]|uniref:Uncharacterized protein n=1 Tax=Oryza meyeriana var. granulata TaxID=110450 RepID=A0A6G1CU15_9ORYZ|nr:hypothetical protein E2562_028170 [Oryza meyeriana var. granulata]
MAYNVEGRGTGGDRRGVQTGTRSCARSACGALSVKFVGGDHQLSKANPRFTQLINTMSSILTGWGGSCGTGGIGAASYVKACRIQPTEASKSPKSKIPNPNAKVVQQLSMHHIHGDKNKNQDGTHDRLKDWLA